MPKQLKDTTVAIIDCAEQGRAIAAIHKTRQQIKVDKILFFTDVHISIPGVEVVVIPKIATKNDYSYFMVKKLAAYIETKYVLVIQHDGYPIRGEAWQDEFYNFDYIGARWAFPETERCVGNGGFSFRSKKLLDALANDEFINCTEQEDDTICRLYGEYLEKKHDIKFALPQVADKFSFELNEPCNYTFGFHGYFHEPFKDHVVISRKAAMGDLILVEPLMSYYHNKGYQVVLDTLPEFMGVFYNHPYKIKHISQMNPKIKPIKVINLDMSYEVKPKQRVLETYYEFAGITDGEIRNSRLNVYQNENQKLFQKYILIHNDETNLPHRNSYGVDWEFVVNYLSRLGYLVFQVGKRTTQHIAPHFNAETKEMLLYIIKGADLVIGLDSGICQIAVALGVPVVVMAGSVDMTLRYVNFEKIQVVQGSCVKDEDKHCYHSQSGTTGVKCKYDEDKPPCAVHSQWNLINAVNKLIKTD